MKIDFKSDTRVCKIMFLGLGLEYISETIATQSISIFHQPCLAPSFLSGKWRQIGVISEWGSSFNETGSRYERSFLRVSSCIFHSVSPNDMWLWLFFVFCVFFYPFLWWWPGRCYWNQQIYYLLINSPPTWILQFLDVKQMLLCPIALSYPLIAPSLGSLGNSNKRSNAFLIIAHKCPDVTNNLEDQGVRGSTNVCSSKSFSLMNPCQGDEMSHEKHCLIYSWWIPVCRMDI